MTYERAQRLLEAYTLKEILDYHDIEEIEVLMLLDENDFLTKDISEPCN
jgi:hypothetical protein